MNFWESQNRRNNEQATIEAAKLVCCLSASLTLAYSLGFSALCTINGSIGESVLAHYYDGYQHKQAAAMGATGGSILGMIWFFLPQSSSENDHPRLSFMIKYLIFSELACMLGYAMLTKAYGSESMSLGQVAASNATGAGVALLPLMLIRELITTCAAVYLASQSQNTDNNGRQSFYPS